MNKSEEYKLKECKLPDTLHELLELALSDLGKIEKNDNYRIDMCTWHSPFNKGKCTVCIAGAVLANTCGLPIGVEASHADISKEVWDKLGAIDYLRQGDLISAYRNFYSLKLTEEIRPHIKKQLEKRQQDYDITSYNVNKRTCKFQLRYLVKFLRNLGV